MADRVLVERRGGTLAFLLGILVTLVVLAAGTDLYVHLGHPPVAVNDPPLPFERQFAHIALKQRIARETRSAPFSADEATLEAGAKIYVNQCAGCHGTPANPKPSMQGAMFPHPPGLWTRHKDGVVGVSDDPPGATYWLVANGVRLSAMPDFSRILSVQQMWQVSLLLKNADQPLSPAVVSLLNASQAGNPQ